MPAQTFAQIKAVTVTGYIVLALDIATPLKLSYSDCSEPASIPRSIQVSKKVLSDIFFGPVWFQSQLQFFVAFEWHQKANGKM